MNPVIYLDIDGVLAPRVRKKTGPVDPKLPERLARSRRDPGILKLDPLLVSEVWNDFSKEACLLVDELCQEFDARLVVTSSWRNVFTPRQLRSVLNVAGIGQYMIGTAPAGVSRPQVILQSLQDLKVTSYVVLDDMVMQRDFGVRSISPDSVFDESCAQKVRRIFKSDGS